MVASCLLMSFSMLFLSVFTCTRTPTRTRFLFLRSTHHTVVINLSHSLAIFSVFNGLRNHLFARYIEFYATKMSKTIFRWLVLSFIHLVALSLSRSFVLLFSGIWMCVPNNLSLCVNGSSRRDECQTNSRHIFAKYIYIHTHTFIYSCVFHLWIQTKLCVGCLCGFVYKQERAYDCLACVCIQWISHAEKKYEITRAALILLLQQYKYKYFFGGMAEIYARVK